MQPKLSPLKPALLSGDYIYYSKSQKLDLIIQLCSTLFFQGEKMALDMSALEAQVAATEGTEASALTLLNGISAQLAAAAGDPVKVAAIAAGLKTSADALAAAVASDTPPTA